MNSLVSRNNKYYLFQSPLFLSALLILFANDFFLKYSYPGLITGKLSDFSGILVVVFFLYGLLGKWKTSILWTVGVLFVWWKSPLSEEFIQFFNSLAPFNIGRVVDYSDLAALIILPLAYYHLKNDKLLLNNTNIHKNIVFRSLVILCTAYLVIACESEELRFRNPVKGHVPYALEGTYLMKRTVTIDTTETIINDTVTFERIKKRQFRITFSYDNQSYLRDIIRKKGDYYFNQYDSLTQSWNIFSFRIQGDSIYDFPLALAQLNHSELKESFSSFSHFDTLDKLCQIIENNKQETLEGFNKGMNNARGNYFVEIQPNKLIGIDSIGILEMGDSTLLKTEESNRFEWTVFPNPFHSKITIKHNSLKPLSGKIITATGKTVCILNIDQRTFQQNLDVLPAGTYIVLLKSEESQQMESFKIHKL